MDGGASWGEAAALRAEIDQEAGHTLNGDAFVGWLRADLDGTVTGTSYMLYLDENSGVDYGIYQDGSADNILGGTLAVAADTDIACEFGRGKIGYNGTDADDFVMAHYDYMNATDYAFRQIGANGAPMINSPTGVSVLVRTNDVTMLTINTTAMTLTQTLDMDEHDIDNVTDIDANTYTVGGVAGVSGSFEAKNGETITAVNGIITGIV